MKIISLLSMVAIAGALFVNIARAESQDIQFHIKAQPATAALQEFAEQSGLQLAYLANITENLRTRKVSGSYEPTEALRMLLDGTGLEYHQVDDKTIAVLTVGDNDRRSGLESETRMRFASAQGGPAIKLAQLQEGAQTTPDTALAQPRESAFPFEEIVVTATKRVERLQDVSIPVTAFSMDRLQEAHVLDLEGLQLISPSVTFATNFGTAQFFMRGLGQNSILNNVESSVGFYVDGAVVNDPSAKLFSFFDLERVEVLRGPQGTLFGRNTTAGAVNLITAKPTEEFEAYARVSGGKFELFETEGALSGPLTDKILGRIAWKTVTRNGLGINEFTGTGIDNLNRKMLRAALQFNISESMDFLVTAEYANQSDRSFSFKVQEESFPDTRPAPGRGGFATQGPRNISSEFDPRNNRETWAITGTFNWQVSDKILIRNIVNYRESDAELVQDVGFSSVVTSRELTPPDPTSISKMTKMPEQFTEELQVHYNGDFLDRHIDVLTGFFYFSENTFFRNTLGISPESGRPRPQPDGSISLEKRANLLSLGDAESFAGFWNVRYQILPQFGLKVGGRWTRDERTVINKNNVFIGPAPGGMFERFVMPGGGEASENFTDYTNELGIEWRPDGVPDMMLYYTFSEGFKAGTAPGGSTLTTVFVDPETIDNHEFGLKSRWLDGRLTVNIAGFFYDINDLQLQISISAGEAGFQTIFANVADQQAHGIEVETTWVITDRMRFTGSVAWLKAKFTRLEGVAPLEPGAAGDFAGNTPRRSPEWSANAHLVYDLPININDGTLSWSTDLAYKSSQFFDEFNNPRQVQDAYVLIDTRIKFTSPDGNWSAEFWGKNLTNELIQGSSRALATGRIIGRTFLDPTTWGGTVHINF